MEPLLSINEAAEKLGLLPNFIRERIRDGSLQCIRLNHNVVRIEESALAAFVAARKKTVVEYHLKPGMRPGAKVSK